MIVSISSTLVWVVRNAWVIGPACPDVGNQPNHLPKISWVSRPNRNTGTA